MDLPIFKVNYPEPNIIIVHPELYVQLQRAKVWAELFLRIVKHEWRTFKAGRDAEPSRIVQRQYIQYCQEAAQRAAEEAFPYP